MGEGKEYQNTKYKPYTKKEIRLIIERLWEDTCTQDIADELHRKKSSVVYLVSRLRQQGLDIPHKRVNGKRDVLIKEVMIEEGIYQEMII